MPNLLSRLNERLSVGILVAATGVGAGDIVLSAIAGGEYGMLLLWAVVLGAILKYVLNLGLAKWDVATGTTFLQGWVQRLPRVVSVYFGLYLVFWSFLVAGTLITFNGLVANTVFPLPVSDAYGIAIWGGLQSVLVAGLIYKGGFSLVENLMKVFIGLMFVVMVVSAVLVCPSWSELLTSSLVPRMGTDLASLQFVAGLIGGVGGTLTILCYSYWLREKQSGEAISLRDIRLDLGVAYALTAVFGMAVMIIAAGVAPGELKGYGMVVGIADELETILGSFGRWAFILGFWGAVFTSMIGVWNGVPYLFADFFRAFKERVASSENQRGSRHEWTTVEDVSTWTTVKGVSARTNVEDVSARTTVEGVSARTNVEDVSARTTVKDVPTDASSTGLVRSANANITTLPAYWWFLLYIAIPPILVAVFGKPVWIALAYAVSGAFFMPFLAALVLYMNNKRSWVGELRNGWVTNALLLVCLVLFLGAFFWSGFGVSVWSS